MADRHTRLQRSFNMSRIRSNGNRTTELRFIELLRSQKITGWRRNYALFGRPDFVFPERRVAIFIDGCFWHGCRSCNQTPTSNEDYWIAKFIRNRLRDKIVTRTLRSEGWHILRVREHALRTPRLWEWRLKKMLGIKGHR